MAAKQSGRARKDRARDKAKVARKLVLRKEREQAKLKTIAKARARKERLAAKEAGVLERRTAKRNRREREAARAHGERKQKAEQKRTKPAARSGKRQGKEPVKQRNQRDKGKSKTQEGEASKSPQGEPALTVVGATAKVLSHVDKRGATRMVDVSAKKVTSREATAEGYIVMEPSTLALIQSNGLPKGDVLAVARVAGVMAAKRTSDLIPMCHPLQITGVTVDLAPAWDDHLRITATVKVKGKTGVEMEALTAVSTAALTVYDMCKAVDRGMRIEGIRLLEKMGGRSGHWVAEKK